MLSDRCFKRSQQLLSALAATAALLVPGIALAQSETVQKPFESGKFAEAIDAAGAHRDDPANTFIAAQAALRLDQADRAREEFRRLESHENAAWKNTGRSALALVDGNVDAAVDIANEAVAADGNNAFAHYQLGMAASRKGDHARAANEFARAAELENDFAYAHYYAGLEFRRAGDAGKAGAHLRRFMELAPEAPERGAVTTLLRALRG